MRCSEIKVIEITRLFDERAIFCTEHVSSEQEHVIWYLIILRWDIHEFVVNTSYQILAEL